VAQFSPVADERDHRFAAEIATDAGRLLVELRAELVADGADRSRLGIEGDRRAHEQITRRLAQDYPADPVLSEEGRDDHTRLGASRVWIVDPLDGTREYGEPPRGDWAVHVALVVDGAPVAGAVSLPAQRLTLGTRPPAPPPPEPPIRPRVIVSRTRPPAVANDIAEALDADLVEMGSAGAKVAAVVLGAADVYAHAGGQYEWDSAAPVAVAAAAGLHASRIDGSPLVYNNPDPSLPDLLVCHPALAERVLTVTAG
jgi:3'(2'), 5'-bisphosphate nucleotidase